MKSNNCISFALNNELVHLDLSGQFGETPITTVLNFLRSRPGYTGCKEGCAEGDCGACTVVIGSLLEGKIRYNAVDSCLVFLPMLHGKQLLTVEHVGSSNDLHPVQSAMIETDGSQCGYCTPGFIMSLLALYKNHNNPTQEDIDDALTGNLCRCTGYRSIAQAAARSCTRDGLDHFTKNEAKVVKILEGIENLSLAINTGKHEYYKPSNLAEAINLKKEHPELLIINGATDVALRVTKFKQDIPAILDLGSVAELNHISNTGTALNIGAGVSLEEVKKLSQSELPALYKTLSVFGSKQIRELATMGGNIASASPIADLPPVLMAYDAAIVLSGQNGEREIPMREFITGYHETRMEEGEIINSITIPFPSATTKVRSYKISKRKDLDISTVSGGFSLNLSDDGMVTDLCLAYGGMAALTKRAVKAEASLLGKPWIRENIEEAMKQVDEDFEPISDARAEKEGRKVMARNLLMKFWTDTNDR